MLYNESWDTITLLLIFLPERLTTIAPNRFEREQEAMTLSNRKIGKARQLTLRGSNASSSTSNLVEEINVMENDKRRMDEWREIFSNFSSSLRSLLSDNFRASIKPESVERLNHRQASSPNATKRRGTKPSRSGSQICSNERRVLLRTAKLDHTDHNGKRKRSSDNKRSLRLEGVDGKLKDFQATRKVHTTSTQKVTGKNQTADKTNHIRKDRGRALAARSAHKEGPKVPSEKRTEGGRKKSGVIVRGDGNCVNSYRPVPRKNRSIIRNEERKRGLGNRPAIRNRRAHEGRQVCIIVEGILNMGLQVSNDVIGVIQDVSAEVEKKCLEGTRPGVSKFRLR